MGVVVLYGQNPDAYESGPHLARVIVDMLSAEDRNASLDDFRRDWRESTGDLADVISIKYTEPKHGPAGRAIDLRLLGYDLGVFSVLVPFLVFAIGVSHGVQMLSAVRAEVFTGDPSSDR